MALVATRVLKATVNMIVLIEKTQSIAATNPINATVLVRVVGRRFDEKAAFLVFWHREKFLVRPNYRNP